MTNLNIPVGVSDFSQIRKNGYYYVDKTRLISELLKKSTANVTLITRPRRFGKTLAMSMLEHFSIFDMITIRYFKIWKSVMNHLFVKHG